MLKTKKALHFKGKLLIGSSTNLLQAINLQATQHFLGFAICKTFAVWTGLEPATPCVTGRYSNQLNYQTVSI